MALDGIAVSATWLRHTPAGADPLFQPPDPADNRWQRGAVIDALCFADGEDLVWAEWYRSLAARGLPPDQGLPRDLWRWEVSLPDVADLSTETRLDAVGLPPPRPTHHQWPAFQAIGERLHAEGWAAVLAPSAARAGGLVLCVFRSHREIPGTVPVPPPVTVEVAPVVPTGLRT